MEEPACAIEGVVMLSGITSNLTLFPSYEREREREREDMAHLHSHSLFPMLLIKSSKRWLTIGNNLTSALNVSAGSIVSAGVVCRTVRGATSEREPERVGEKTTITLCTVFD